ncbi:MAG: gamma carbonic anhydrase family protein [Sphaerochaeta sp.]|nr:gamma carbonic anhydrase family protein [Sphaerochaeta sp.]
MIRSYNEKSPQVGEHSYIAPSADIIGDAHLGDAVSVWFHATIRADEASITIGDQSNIQDNAVLHVSKDMPIIIGKRCTVGHGTILHSCTIGDDCLIGMGSIILDGAIIGEQTMVAAGTLVPQGKTYPKRCLLMGSPAKVARELTEQDLEHMEQNTKSYYEFAQDLVSGKQRIE